ncbi:transposase InsO family protein [Paraburkholderia sp. WSM4177]|nr:transposase InsO family protein [Paraburkholderia sp. WSM4177]MBB5486764.1 transposase InsO family protein [Paraburkholderia sp. WSM4180]
MTDGYDYYRNALAERIKAIPEGDFLLQRPADLKQAAKMVEQSVRTYNYERPHAEIQNARCGASGTLASEYCQPIPGFDTAADFSSMSKAASQ